MKPTFEVWCEQVCAGFDSLGGRWVGYGNELIASDIEAARVVHAAGWTAGDLINDEVDFYTSEVHGDDD